jgi:hypothetical protein
MSSPQLPVDAGKVGALLDGPAFSVGVKLLASGMMGGLAVYGWRTLDAMQSTRWSWPALLLMVVALGLVVLCYVWMLRSRTCISSTHVRQSWIRDKQIALSDITQIKLIYFPRLAWLISPRLVVRSRMPGTMVFHSADAQVLQAFARLTRSEPPLP